jgi:hypothetical protein
MLRKTVLGLVAAAALAAVAAPTAASAKGFHLHIGGPGYGYGPSYGYGYGYTPYYGPDCYFKKVKVWSHKWDKWTWKTKKVCY